MKNDKTLQRTLNHRLLYLLRCPATKTSLVGDSDNSRVSTVCGSINYKVSKAGVPLLVPRPQKHESKLQQKHYDTIAQAYCANLSYPHTKEYLRYLDSVLLRIVQNLYLGRMAEICCGKGEAVSLLHESYEEAVGVDISEAMLNEGVQKLKAANALLVQGDATNLPMQSGIFDSVVMLGGIHHVNSRNELFLEVSRILKPGGILIFREPVDDFFLWRWIRAAIYRISPNLDYNTERPLRFSETDQQLRDAGLELSSWKTYGFIGFCFFMNSDVLIFNRLFRFVPGIRLITRAFVTFDRVLLSIPGFRRCGLQVIAVSRKVPA